MGERLSIVKQVPQHVFDWWSELGGGAPLLAQAYPKATITGVLRPGVGAVVRAPAPRRPRRRGDARLAPLAGPGRGRPARDRAVGGAAGAGAARVVRT